MDKFLSHLLNISSVGLLKTSLFLAELPFNCASLLPNVQSASGVEGFVHMFELAAVLNFEEAFGEGTYATSIDSGLSRLD